MAAMRDQVRGFWQLCQAALALCAIAAMTVPALAAELSPGPARLKPEAGPRFFSIRQVFEARAAIPHAGPENWSLRLATLPDTASLAAMAPAMPFAARGYGLFRANNAHIAAEWYRVQAEWSRERASLARCTARPQTCSPAEAEAQSILDAARAAPVEERVALVHRRVNAAIAYRADPWLHGVADRWSSPLATLRRAGDCEDFAIAKYLLLREAGIDEADLGLVLLRDRNVGEDHAVLAVRGEQGWTLYDNRYDTPDSDAETAHYRPLLLVSSERIAMFAAPFVEADDIEAAPLWGMGAALPDAIALLPNGTLSLDIRR